MDVTEAARPSSDAPESQTESNPDHPTPVPQSVLSRLQLLVRRVPFNRRRVPDSLQESGKAPNENTDAEGDKQAELSNVGDFNPVVQEKGDTGASSKQVFAEIGASLRKRREMLSLTYEELERHTHVRKAFLKALEDGDLDDLPSPVQTRGILANYAAFLDLDVDAVLLRFADGLQARHREQRQQQPGRSRTPMTVNTSLPPLRSFIASDLLFGGGVAIMLLLFAVWGINRVISIRSSAPVGATAPSISDVLVGTPLPTLAQQVTLIPADASVEATSPEATATVAAPTLNANVAVQLQLTSAARTFLRVTVDGRVQFDGRTEPGQVITFQAAKSIEIVTGNAGALQVLYNGRDLGVMGQFGDAMDLIYSAEGVATPTTTPAPTRTPTPKVSPTPTETRTPTPTVAPKPTSGG